MSVRNAPKNDSGPKNGPMIVGVVSTIVVMIVLTFINMRLLSAPTTTNEAVNQLNSSKKLNPVLPEMNSRQSDYKICQPPPEVTFYSQLKTKEEKTSVVSSTEALDNRVETSRSSSRASHGNPVSSHKEDKSFSSPASSGQPTSSMVEQDKEAPSVSEKPGSDTSKGFVVQVGAFSHPRIAQEWASKWQAKGYKATLKPVARPSSGIIYRLYLGDFESEKKADEFVKQLKTKEGISAMRLNARD